MMDTIFGSQIGKDLQIYVDDMIAMLKKTVDHVKDLRETFENARKHNMRLNPAKCSFGLTSEKFLRFLVFQRWIEADPTQIKVFLDMRDPTSINEVQKLTGYIAALRRFIPQASKRCLPFFQVIKNALRTTPFCWNDECRQSFEALKEFLTIPPIPTRAVFEKR